MARTSFCALRKPLSQMNGYLPASPGGNRRKLRGNLARRENRIDVNAHRVFHVSRVAARERRRHGNAALARLLKHFAEARKRGVPVATTLAGGYARNVEDTVRIHVNTILAAREVAAEFPAVSARGSG